MPETYHDPVTGRPYRVDDDGTARWLDEPQPEPRPEPRFEPQTYAQPAPVQYPRPRARRGRFLLGLLVGLILGAAAGAGAVALGSDTTTSTPTTTASTASTAPAAARTTSTGERAFLVTYRKALPALAAGRKDAATLRKNTKARFTGQDGTAPTTAEADAIVELVKLTVCS